VAGRNHWKTAWLVTCTVLLALVVQSAMAGIGYTTSAQQGSDAPQGHLRVWVRRRLHVYEGFKEIDSTTVTVNMRLRSTAAPTSPAERRASTQAATGSSYWRCGGSP